MAFSNDPRDPAYIGRHYQRLVDAGEAMPIEVSPEVAPIQSAPDAKEALNALNKAFQCLYLEVDGSIVDDLRRRFDEYLAAQLALQHKRWSEYASSSNAAPRSDWENSAERAELIKRNVDLRAERDRQYDENVSQIAKYAALEAERDRLQEALRAAAELFEAILVGKQTPHSALRKWAKKFSVRDGQADTSWMERVERCVKAALLRARAALVDPAKGA